MHKYQKSFVPMNKMCLMVRFIKTMTYQCRQLKLSPLSTQIIIYYLMTNQTPTFLIQRAPWTRAAVMLNLQYLTFSHPPPAPLSYNPWRLPPWYISQSTWLPLTVRSAISWRSHGKIGDCEQSICFDKEKSKITSGY